MRFLRTPVYYFCIDGESDYPILPSFDHFRFPTRLPDSWSSDRCAAIQLATSDRVPDRDQTCRITCSSLPNEIAHIVPAAQEDWWRANSMFLHASRPESSIDTNCPDNAILLRRDLHYLWDNHKFAIVPKQGRWVVHVLDNLATNELQERYHNLETQHLIGVAREFLLARFALVILTAKGVFAKQGYLRKFIILEDNKPQLRVVSGKECRVLFGPPSKSRSQSPKKRQKSTPREENEDVLALSSVNGDSSEQENWEAEQWSQPGKREWSPSLAKEYWHSCLTERNGSDQEEEHRGRSRKRQRVSPDLGGLSTTSDSESMPSSVETSFGNSATRGTSATGHSGHKAHASAETTEKTSDHSNTVNVFGEST